ncbi:NfeD family protein [Candidatus Mycoplasma pogonae]
MLINILNAEEVVNAVSQANIIKWIMFGFWLAIIIISLLVEIFTSGIISGLITVATVPSLILSATTEGESWSIGLQFAIAVVIWVVLYFTLYKILKKHLRKDKGFTNPVYDMIGVETELLEDSYEIQDVTTNYGKVLIFGRYYRTVSEHGQGHIHKNTKVVIKKIEGNTLYIAKHHFKKHHKGEE